MKDSQRKAMFAVQKKSVYTDHKWKDVSKHDFHSSRLMVKIST